jgi:hypothetical protein
MQDSLDATGRKIMLSGEGGPPPDVCSRTGHCGNLRRIGHDITPFWSSITSMIDLSYRLAPFAHNASGPNKAGFWNDMDVLEVGNGDFDCTTPESIGRAKAHMGMWVLMKSPLLLGTDMTFTANPQLEKTILGIVGNPRVLSINQDPLGVQARRAVSMPGPGAGPGALTDADVTLVVSACNSSRPTQFWHHNASSASSGVGALWTRDAEGTRWCATSLAAGMWNLFRCDGVNASTICQGSIGTTCRDNITICDDEGQPTSHCTPIGSGRKPGRRNVTIMNWQGLHAGTGCDEFGSGPVPHSCYIVNNGAQEFTFDPSAVAGSTISPRAGGMVIDDDNVGNSQLYPAESFCLDVALGGNLEVWTAPLTEGRHAVGLLNRSPSVAKITASWNDLGLTGKYDVQDAWSGETVGVALDTSLAMHTRSQALSLLILSPT